MVQSVDGGAGRGGLRGSTDEAQSHTSAPLVCDSVRWLQRRYQSQLAAYLWSEEADVFQRPHPASASRTSDSGYGGMAQFRREAEVTSSNSIGHDASPTSQGHDRGRMRGRGGRGGRGGGRGARGGGRGEGGGGGSEERGYFKEELLRGPMGRAIARQSESTREVRRRGL